MAVTAKVNYKKLPTSLTEHVKKKKIRIVYFLIFMKMLELRKAWNCWKYNIYPEISDYFT